MSIEDLIHDLSTPDAWDGQPVEVRQTHASVVFLVGDRAWKVKKPVSLGFLDFSTPELRLRCCEEEVRVNRRLAPRVYLGVVEVVLRGGRYRVGGPGEVVDHAVSMVRLPDAAAWSANLPTAGEVREIGSRIAAFHAAADRGPEIGAWATFERVAANLRGNFAQSRGQVGRVVQAAVHARLEALTEAALADRRDHIEARALRACDTHGDLRLDHVYRFPDRSPPDDFVVLDAIEFNAAFRFADPVSDVAFLAMDLGFRGRDDLARELVESWIAASGDHDGRPLMGLYRSYRAAVRGKVAGIQALEAEVGAEEQARSAQEARARWLFALVELEAPGRKPLLLGVGGLPGTGKSTLARGLTGLTVIRSDVVRKELAGLAPTESAAAPLDSGLYTADHTARTYAECFRRAREVLRGGGRALVDATFRDEASRAQLVATAREEGAPAALFLCTASAEAVRARLDRRAGDASDADWRVYQHAAAGWKEPSGDLARITRRVRTDGSKEASIEAALAALRERDLAD